MATQKQVLHRYKAICVQETFPPCNVISITCTHYNIQPRENDNFAHLILTIICEQLVHLQVYE